jgi:hypothetical protein
VFGCLDVFVFGFSLGNPEERMRGEKKRKREKKKKKKQYLTSVPDIQKKEEGEEKMCREFSSRYDVRGSIEVTVLPSEYHCENHVLPVVMIIYVCFFGFLMKFLIVKLYFQLSSLLHSVFRPVLLIPLFLLFSCHLNYMKLKCSEFNSIFG